MSEWTEIREVEIKALIVSFVDKNVNNIEYKYRVESILQCYEKYFYTLKNNDNYKF